MQVKEDFDLYHFLADSLNLRQITNYPTRASHSKYAIEPYKLMSQQNPYTVLGEIEFKKPKPVTDDAVGTPIQDFFRGAHIFVTGGTGFIGKLLTEKLVRSMPHLGQIYLLIRDKRGKSAQQRFELVLEDAVFRRMKAEVPDYASKLTVVEGDISAPGLGLSAADKRTLLDHVTMVFHSAADVRFIEPLRSAVISNVIGSRSMLALARGMNNLKSYVHVSTAYSQCVRRVVPETVPKMSVHYKEVIALIESLTDEEIEKAILKILHGWPNTYTFTKAMCEEMLQEEGKGLPICIFRPAAVVCTYKEPVRGWTDNVYGPLGSQLAILMGLQHCSLQEKDLVLDMVPADYTVNCLITCAWDSIKNKVPDSLPVYNYVSTPSNHVTWGTRNKYARMASDIFSIQQSIWYYSIILFTSPTAYAIAHVFLHRIPGFVLDNVAVWNGQKPRLTKIYDKLYSLTGHFRYFTTQFWEFESENVQKMLYSMTPEDKALFNFDLRDVDTLEQILLTKLGFRYYLLKEKMETLPRSQKKNKMFWWLHNGGKCVLGLALLKVLVVVANVLPI